MHFIMEIVILLPSYDRLIWIIEVIVTDML